MNDQEFLRAVQEVYQREIARGRTPSQAHKRAEAFRSDLRVTLARQSLERVQQQKAEQ